MKKLVTFIALLAIATISWAQSNPEHIGPSSYEVQLVPPNPDVASLNKFGDIPVNKYNGTANVSVPIHTIDLDGLQIPLNLTYNTGGVRVNQDASWVGLGWNLSDGIVITREVNGFEDIKDYSFSNNHQGWIYAPDRFFPVFPETQFTLDADELFDLDNDYRVNTPEDTQPDVFSVNLPSGSFKFYLPKRIGAETELDAIVINNTNYKVSYDINNQTFKVTDTNGFVYIFDEKEFSTSYNTDSSSSASTDFDALNALQELASRHRLFMISSWKVSKIISPYNNPGQDNAVLEFSYAPGFFVSFPNFSEDYKLIVSENNVTGSGPATQITAPTSTNATLTAFNTLYLSEISGSFGAVRFVLGDRIDLFSEAAYNSWTGSSWNLSEINFDNGTPKLLETINVVDASNSLVKTADFYYCYFNEDDTNQSIIERYLRLKLDGVVVQDQIYSFFYDSPDDLPPRDSKAIDFWGFYNGQETNTHRIPSMNRFFGLAPLPSNNDATDEGFFKRLGADRSSDINFGKRGILTRVVYPTGGSTEFAYEGNSIVLRRVNYEPTFDGGDLEDSGIRTSEGYNFRYQQLKLADDPAYTLYDYAYIDCLISTSSLNGTGAFTIPDDSFCDSDQTHNVQFTATLNCGPGCNQGIDPSGRAVWVKNVQTGQETTIFRFEGHFNVNTTSVTLNDSRMLPAGNYTLNVETFTNVSPLVVATVNSPAATIWEDVSTGPPPDIYEAFEVGGARISKIVNKDIGGNVLNTKVFDYDHQIPDGSISSSGLLMDDLIFWSTPSSLFEYSPEFLPANGSTHAFLSSYNKLRVQNAASGSHIGYSKVTEYMVDGQGNDNGQIVTSYVNRPNEYINRNVGLSAYLQGCISCSTNPYDDIGNLSAYIHVPVGYGEVYILGAIPDSFDYINGSVEEETVYNSTGNPVSKTVKTYEEIGGPETFPNPRYPILFWNGQGFPIVDTHFTIDVPQLKNRKFLRLKKSIATSYLDGGEVVNTTDYFYENIFHYLLTRTTVTDSEGDVTTIRASYPEDNSSDPGMAALISQNRMSSQVKAEIYHTDAGSSTEEFMSSQETIYRTNNNPLGIAMPDEVLTLKNESTVELRQTYDQYDDKGNLLQVTKADGTPTSYVWGYNQEYPVARIDNADYASVQAISFDTSILNNTGSSDAAKQAELKKIRDGLPNAMVTTYTYDPMVGITSVTDPRGYTMTYIYDSSNRLQEVRDAEDNIVTDYQYRYAVQN